MKKIIILMLLFNISFVLAVGNPTPHGFYGNVYYSDGVLIGESLEIRAEISGGSETMNLVNGVYDLVVESNGGTIYFYIEGLTVAIGSYTFDSFAVTELDFTTALSNPSPQENETTDGNSESPVDSGNGGGSSGGGGGGGGGSGGGGSSSLIILTPEEETGETELHETISAPIPKTENQQSPTTSGITGAVVGFVKTGKGAITLLFLMMVVLVGIVTVSKMKSRKK